jgi:hypothetical protein
MSVLLVSPNQESGVSFRQSGVASIRPESSGGGNERKRGAAGHRSTLFRRVKIATPERSPRQQQAFPLRQKGPT